MKIRNGFVSNSSSSSFLITLPHRPQDAQDLAGMFYPGMSIGDKIDDDLTVGTAVEDLWKQIGTQKKSFSSKKIIDCFVGFSYCRYHFLTTIGFYDFEKTFVVPNREQWFFTNSDNYNKLVALQEKEEVAYKNYCVAYKEQEDVKERLKKIWFEISEEVNSLEKEVAEEDAKVFVEDVKGKFVCLVSFSDHSEDEDFSLLEFSYPIGWENVQSIYLSNH